MFRVGEVSGVYLAVIALIPLAIYTKQRHMSMSTLLFACDKLLLGCQPLLFFA